MSDPIEHPQHRGKVSMMPDLAELDRNDIKAALDVWRKALALDKAGKLRDDELGDVAEELIMLQDNAAEFKQLMFEIK